MSAEFPSGIAETNPVVAIFRLAGMFRETSSSLEPWLKKEVEYVDLFANDVLKLNHNMYHDTLC